jgi:putative endonuclease
MPFFAYILQSETTGKTYVGQTADMDHRLAQHNDPGCLLTTYTKRNKGPWKVIYVEPYSTRAEAMRREKKLKTGVGREWIQENLLSR